MFQNKPLLITLAVLLVALVIGPIIWGLTQQPSQRGGGQGTQELVIWNLFDEEDAFARIIQNYRVQRPGVQVTYRRFTNVEQYQRLLATELAEGKGPDIFAVHVSQLQSERGTMVPMPVDYQGLTIPVFRENFVPVTYQTLVFPETIQEGGQSIERERLWAMPLYVDNLALIYNEAMLEQFARSAFPRAFWTGLTEQVGMITNRSSGTVTRSGIAMGSPDTVRRTSDLFALLVLQFGGRFYNEERTQHALSERASFNGQSITPANEAFAFVSSFANPTSRNYSWSDELTYGDDQKEIAAFVRGDTAMIIGYSYYLSDIASTIRQFSSTTATITNSQVRVAPMPQIGEPGDDSRPAVTLADFYPLAVSRNAAYPNTAWDFLLFAAQDEQMRHYFDRTKKPVSKRTLIDDLARTNPAYEVFLKQTLDARVPVIVNRPEYDTMVLRLFSDILSGRGSVEEASNRLGRYLECSLGVAQRRPDFLDRFCLDE